jgi:uncharacterized protein YlxW (UPF0749 family)
MDFHQGIRDGRIVLFLIQIGTFLVIALIVWLSIRAFRRYKDQYVDPEKAHLIEQMSKMREVSNRLTKRNQDLAQQVADLRQQLANLSHTTSSTTDTQWYH